MKRIENVGLKDVQGVYGGPEGDLWELIMGQQVHIGGFKSSMDLARKAGIRPGMKGIDLCCCNGGGMRFLVRFCEVDSMRGVDATEQVVKRGRARTEAEGLAGRITFHLADVCQSGLPGSGADFVWGEDAWCYVEDKRKLIAEAARLVRPGGTIAFTDWIEADDTLTEAEAERYLKFMKFPGIYSLRDYTDALIANGCKVQVAEKTGRFAPCIDLYLNMLDLQLTYDALRIIQFDAGLMQNLAGEMQFVRQLAQAGKIDQGLIVARKTA
jgi:ubiquinone/menaquinone biosynthesis C-methylase UbiE